MSENTKIEWADHTFNPWMGCTKISTHGSGSMGFASNARKHCASSY